MNSCLRKKRNRYSGSNKSNNKETLLLFIYDK